MTAEIELYAVRNQEGHWFRAKGYGGYGATWVPELKNAKLYARIGQARSRVTYFATNYPEYGCPEVVRLVAREAGAIPGEAARAATVIAKNVRRKEERAVRIQRARVVAAKRDLDRAKAELDEQRRRASRLDP